MTLFYKALQNIFDITLIRALFAQYKKCPINDTC